MSLHVPDPASPRCRGWRALAEGVLAAVVLAAWAGLTEQLRLGAAWCGPVLLLAAWVAGRDALGRRYPGWPAEAGLGLALVVGAMLLPAWPGAETPTVRALVIFWAWVATRLWRGVTKLAGGPTPAPAEYARTFLLLTVVLGTWWAYFTPRIVGVVDERWYGDLMTDFLGQVRSGIFPVLVGQGEFAWNGNVHPFRSAPLHHNLGAVVDLVTARQLTPLAVQHLVLLGCVFATTGTLYVGLRRLRPARPWLAVLVTVLLATCPAFTMAQIQHDMYMTMAALPVTVFVALCLVRILEGGSGRAWLWLGAGLGAVWFCHPPVAFLTTCTAALILFSRFIAGPVEARDCRWALAAGAVFVATCSGYFLSMAEVSPLRSGDKAVLENVLAPGLGLAASLMGVVGLHRTQRPVLIGLAAGGVILGLVAIRTFHPQLLGFTVTVLAAWTILAWAGRRFPASGLGRWPELVLAGCVLVTGAVLGPKLAGDATVDAWIESARTGYRQLWLPLRAGGDDQLGYALVAGLVGALVVVFRRPTPAGRALLLAVLGLSVALAPIPGFVRFFWQNLPAEVIDIIGVGYPLRFLPVTAPFAAILIFVALAGDEPGAWARWARVALLVALPWAEWEHVEVVRRSWVFRHPPEHTARHLRSENRAISRFHYDLQPMPRYHNHGVTDYRLETRLWLRRPGPDNFVGPNEYARQIAAGQASGWQDLGATQDKTYPAWLYLAPKLVLGPGEHRLLTFEWLDPTITGWLILRSEGIHREYLLPEFGGSRSFGLGAGKHQTLSLWNSGAKPEEVEIVVKREGAGYDQPYTSTAPVVRLRSVAYDAYAAPVEVARLAPLQLRTTTAVAATVETFRIWLPGYRVSVDGQPVPYWRSHNGLLEYPVPAGSHVADIRFRGTPQLRLAVSWSLLVGGLLCGALVAEGVRLARRMPSPAPVR